MQIFNYFGYSLKRFHIKSQTGQISESEMLTAYAIQPKTSVTACYDQALNEFEFTV